jgi:hypothetical protein
MSKNTVLLLSLLVLVLERPAFADPAPTGTPLDQNAPTEKPGLVSRFARLFDGFDTTKPENQHVFVIGASNSTQQAGSRPSDQAPAAVAPTVSESTQAEPAAPGHKLQAHGFTLKSGFQQDNEPNGAAPADRPPQ